VTVQIIAAWLQEVHHTLHEEPVTIPEVHRCEASLCDCHLAVMRWVAQE
jgi:hypothetical protein